MFLPRISNSGITVATAASSPPIMIDSARLRAPTSPPETGASTALQPWATARSLISRASVGSVVVMSTSRPPGFAPARMPRSEK